MDFKELLDNKPLLFGLIGGAIVIVALILVIAVAGGSKSTSGGTEITGEPIKEDVNLLWFASSCSIS